MRDQRVVLITGASSGFGRLTAESLARAGHTVIAGMRDIAGRNASNRLAIDELAAHEQIAISAVDLDVGSQSSVDAAVAATLAEHDRIDVIVHNAGHMALGPAEAFTPEQLADQSTPTSSARNGSTAPCCRSCVLNGLAW